MGRTLADGRWIEFAVMTTGKEQIDAAPHHGPEHRDVSGGWLRPAVFGAMDGLVTNVSLIAGVGGGGGSQHAIVLTGLAGLAAGAFSMAAGEFVSVSSQNELVHSEVDKEKHELDTNAVAEQLELVGMLRRRGISAATARQAAAEISAHPDKALAIHAFEELGVNPADLPSPAVAAAASLVAFSIGAIIPLFPYVDRIRRALGRAGPVGACRDRGRRPGGATDRPAVLERRAAAARARRDRGRLHLHDRPRRRRDGGGLTASPVGAAGSSPAAAARAVRGRLTDW